MMSHFRQFQREPFLFLAALWPLVLLTPHIPGLPRPSVGGLPWRQELCCSFLLCLMLGIIVRHLWTRPEKTPFNSQLLNLPLFLCGALFTAWVWLSALWAVQPSAAVHLACQWSAFLIFLALMSSALTRPRVVRTSFKALGVVFSILGIACAIESWFGSTLTDGNSRSDLKPILRGSGGFGEIMAVATTLFAALALRQKRPRRAVLCGVIATLAWLGTLQSLERAPFLGASVGLILLFAVALIKRNCRPLRLSRLGLLAAVFAGVLLLQALPDSTSETVQTTVPNQIIVPDHDTSTLTRLRGGLDADANTHVRLLYWGIGLEMLRAHPLLGVGGSNYDVAYTEARAQFSARNPDSPLISLNDFLLAVYAHNEYVQMLAELGLIGFSLFVLFCVALLLTFLRALKHPTHALVALGAAAGMLAFAISSGASASSFRYFGGGLLFFFAASVVTCIAAHVNVTAADARETQAPRALIRLRPLRQHAVAWCVLLVLAFAMTCSFSAQAAGSMLHGMAQASVDRESAEKFYNAALRLDGTSASTHYSFGMWLLSGGRVADSLPHLRYAVARGFNSSTCYAYLAGAEDAAGDVPASEQTLRKAVRVYPRSIFLRVRHAAALERAGRNEEAGMEMSAAILLDSRAARGWYQLIVKDIDAALVAAREDQTIALPGELKPQDAVFAVLAENEKRFPDVANTGWRKTMRSTKF